ncbi:uncharacterized protein BYT42DRAFT_609993 [Radiomyces spectabilis]|uniref:uncharacterized protein n=1 Tax=Radiomyces spectabilis TaxID=64574 RepID=UPI0022204698|nr:uncharacterized protein BYT42DRAFT_609993 [Radiomyces spectabilis]KAI8394263.1 hypothetical protein BYT42DRAFT_609993 [Radiomyces spectabilis]
MSTTFIQTKPAYKGKAFVSVRKILHTATSTRHDDPLPPVLVEVQHMANMSFYRRLMVMAYRSLSGTRNIPFLLEISCDNNWAKSCYILNASSIADHLQHTPLNPLVALGHFLIQRKRSLRDVARNDDITVKKIYNIAKGMFGDNLQHDSDTDVLQEIYDQCNEARTALCEDVTDVTSRKRTIDCLDKIINMINDQQEAPTTPTANKPNNSDAKGWEFAENYRKDHGAFNWESIFQLGKTKGLFKSYAKWTGAKSAYYRQKRQKQ